VFIVLMRMVLDGEAGEFTCQISWRRIFRETLCGFFRWLCALQARSSIRKIKTHALSSYS